MGLRVPRPSSVGTQILSWMRRLVSSFFQSQWVKIGHCASTVTKVADFCLLFIHTYLTYHHYPLPLKNSFFSKKKKKKKFFFLKKKKKKVIFFDSRVIYKFTSFGPPPP